MVTMKRNILTLKSSCKMVANAIYLFWENKAWQFIWIVCYVQIIMQALFSWKKNDICAVGLAL